MSKRVTNGDAVVAHFHHTSNAASQILKETFETLFSEGEASIPIGWAAYATLLCGAITVLAPAAKIRQIKTKFGGGRVSFTDNTYASLPPIILTLAHDFEKQTSQICELCGCNGTKRTRNMWIVTCCNVCADTIGAT